MRTLLLLLASLLILVSTAHSADGWLQEESYDGVCVAVSQAASPSERYAASEFKKYWRMCTGHEPGDGPAPAGGSTVWIGREGVPAALLRQLDLDGLGPDGLHIKSVGTDLLIVGGQQRGTMYGVYEFFQRYMGVRWLAPDYTHVPSAPPSLPRLDFRYVPVFEWRTISYRAFLQNPWFAAVHRLNGQHPQIGEEMGGHIAYANGFGHTFHSFVSPDEYGESHPEYFSLVDGKRLVKQKGTQLCLTNPDVLDIVVEKTRGILRESMPARKIVSVTQMDTGFWCECADCKAIDDREDSHAGSVLWFVNRVAEAIEDEFPGAYIDTFAYTYTRKPPKHLRPRDNVIVRLCSIECDFSHPLADRQNRYNRAFQKDIKRWSKITKNLYIWDYTQNWYSHQQPQPNFHVLQPNVKFFADHGVKGLFEQSSPTSPHSDFEYLKGYILGRAVWDPEVDWRELFDEFIALYYREAGPYIHEYIKLITSKVLADEYYLAFNSKLEWMDYDTVVKADAIFQKAFAVAQDDVLRERLRSVYLPVQYAALVCIPNIELTDDAYILSRPPSQTFDEYWAMITDMGVTMLEDQPIKELRERLGGKTPPRYQRVTIEKIENEFYEVWVLPELNGSVVRFLDKRTGIDLFRGEEAILNSRWRWQDWEVMDPDDPEVEEGIEGVYDVVERAGGLLTVERALDNGLTVRRSMRLDPGVDALEVAFTITNQGERPVRPLIKPHPEFWLQGPYTPQIWIERDGVWQRQGLNYVGPSETGADRIEPEGMSRCAFHVPRKRLTLTIDFCPDQLDSVFYYFNLPNEQVNLELVPDLSPLAPGASRTVTATYSISRKSPGRL
ncbi:MAG: DUF4838 domain-containing protein [Nitrospiraceae bacterium]|nr:DUF4838 domain-containing protein [Nitrospiraceae bacterium]